VVRIVSDKIDEVIDWLAPEANQHSREGNSGYRIR